MREIEFRAKHYKTGKFVYGLLVRKRLKYSAIQMCTIGKKIKTVFYIQEINHINDVDELTLHKVQPCTIGQYAGLPDKNGKKIFEGDIYHQGDKNIKYKVIFKYGQFIGNQIGNQSLAGLSYWIDVIEVIGNIHE